MTDREQKRRISDIDRFDKLPNEVVKHILSFLDMKEVLGTTVLARRWRELWRSLHTLEFSVLMFNHADTTTRYQQFEGFVSHVMSSLDEIKLEKLILTCSFIDLDKFGYWMNMAFYHHVQVIHFNDIILPATFDAHVKTLILKNCLYHRDCFTVSSPRLECLKVQCGGLRSIPEGKIKILAPNLTALQLQGYLFKGYIMDNLSALVTAEIEVYVTDIYRHDPDIIWSSFRDIFIGVCTVEYLTVTTHLLQHLPESPDLFNKLLHLKLIGNERNHIKSWEKLSKNFPILETLTLEASKPISCTGSKGDFASLSYCRTFHHLKKIDIRTFGGSCLKSCTQFMCP